MRRQRLWEVRSRRASRCIRSRIALLSYITTFSLATYSGDYPVSLADQRFHYARETGGTGPVPEIGDLVALKSAPVSKWYLSWIVGIGSETSLGREYLLESIEDGACCRWSNVGLVIYDRATVADHPEWRWTDSQWLISDMWSDSYTRLDLYWKPLLPVFDGDAVTLGIRMPFEGIESDKPIWCRPQMVLGLEAASDQKLLDKVYQGLAESGDLWREEFRT